MKNLKWITEGQRYAFCMVPIAPIRAEQADRSEQISQLLFGEMVEIIGFGQPWVRVKSLLDHYEGYLDFKHLLPLTEKELRRWLDQFQYATEKTLEIESPYGRLLLSKGACVGASDFQIGAWQFERSVSVPSMKTCWEHAYEYLNSPYLWGGKSLFGIDCSGLTQMVFRLQGINLPRDAYQQAEGGQEITFEDRQENDLLFFQNAEGKVIHVGILGAGDQLIHAAGRVRIDELREQGIFNADMQQLTHHFHSIRRY
ncbi:MAG: hypothetical protein RLZZ301_1381 [Bacteroidota bacterium]|jgi:cell wall-associated NlpC family hydrolase